MKNYEVSINMKANSRFIPNRFVCGYIVETENIKQAKDFAYELYRSEIPDPFSRECLRISAEVFKG